MSPSKTKAKPATLSPEQRAVLNEIDGTRSNFFITGRAGTGKSVLLRAFKHVTRKKLVLVAPTGIAGLNIGAPTIHSAFGFPPRLLTRKEAGSVLLSAKKRELLENADCIVREFEEEAGVRLLDPILQEELVARGSTMAASGPREFGGACGAGVRGGGRRSRCACGEPCKK